MIKKIIISLCFIFFSFQLSAKTLEIEMLNKLGKEKMVYSVKVAKIDVDDKIIWKSVSKGHNVEFIGMPKGVKKFKTKINKDAEFIFKKKGVYLYQCTPHKAMGMIGLVIVGNDKSNLEDIKALKYKGMSKKFAKQLIEDIENNY